MKSCAITPQEKKKLVSFIKQVKKLSRKPHLSDTGRFIMFQQTRMVLKLLGEKDPDRKVLVDCIDVIRDFWPFKIFRLKKLIYGRSK